MIVVEDTDDNDILLDTGITGQERTNIIGFLDNDKALVIAKVGNSWYGNGVPEANLNITADEWTRLRISISEATASKKDLQIIAANGAPNPCADSVHIISYDGVPRSSIPSEAVTAVTVTGASRVDLAIKCSEGEAFIEYGNAVAARLLISGLGDATITPFDGGSPWTPFRPLYLEDLSDDVVPPGNTYQVTMTASQINGEAWDAENPLLEYGKDQVFEWTLSGTNAHPFHIHLYHMQIVSPEGCGHHEYGEWYDTISARGDCKVRFRTNDVGGRCVLHCHVLSHEDNGSMHWIDVTGFGPPSDTDPPVGEFPCGTVPAPTPALTPAPAPTPPTPTVDCSQIFNKSDCNAAPGCQWSNRNKECV